MNLKTRIANLERSDARKSLVVVICRPGESEEDCRARARKQNPSANFVVLPEDSHRL